MKTFILLLTICLSHFIYVIKTATSWSIYSENGTANILLIYPETGGLFFIRTSN